MLLVQACRLAGVDRRENTGQEGESHRRAHRSLETTPVWSRALRRLQHPAYALDNVFSKNRLSRRNLHVLSSYLSEEIFKHRICHVWAWIYRMIHRHQFVYVYTYVNVKCATAIRTMCLDVRRKYSVARVRLVLERNFMRTRVKKQKPWTKIWIKDMCTPEEIKVKRCNEQVEKRWNLWKIVITCHKVEIPADY